MKYPHITTQRPCSRCGAYRQCHNYGDEPDWLCEVCLDDDTDYFDPYPHASWEAWYEHMFVEMCQYLMPNLMEDWLYEEAEAVPIAGGIFLEALPSRETCLAVLRSRRVPRTVLEGHFVRIYESVVEEADHWLAKYG